MPIPGNSTVTIYFTGLLVFCFNKDKKHCQIGIHSQSDDHELKIRIVKKRDNTFIDSVQNLTIPHHMIREGSDLWLDVESSSPARQHLAERYLVGDYSKPPTDPQDFRHVIDLEGEHFYNRQLKIKKRVLNPSLFVCDGLFYTARLTSVSYQTFVADATGNAHKHGGQGPAIASIGKVAAYVGANIYLSDSNEAVVLRAGQNGSKLFSLKRQNDETSYEITLENGPAPNVPAGDHFAYFYDAVDLTSNEPRILVTPTGMEGKQSTTKTGSDDCRSLQLGQTTGF